MTPCTYSGAGGLRLDSDGLALPCGAHASLSAVADQSAFLAGTRSIGVRSGAGARLQGTSGASPAAARLMVINAAHAKPLMAGFQGPLAMPESAMPTTDLVRAKHAARTGSFTAPSIGRATRPQPANNTALLS